MQGARDVADGHAQVLGAVSVERHTQLRFVHKEIGLRVHETLDLGHATHKGAHHVGELREIGILHDVLDRRAKANRARGKGVCQHSRDAHELREHASDCLVYRRVPLAPVLHDDADERAVHAAGEPPDDREIPVDVRGSANDLLNLAHVAVGIRQRRAFRAPHGHEEEAAVVGRDQLPLQPRPWVEQKRSHGDGDDCQRPEQNGNAVIDGAPQQLRIPLRHRIEAALEQLEGRAVLVLHPQDLGAEHRRERERDEARDHDRTRHGDAELAQQSARGARHERERRKHRH